SCGTRCLASGADGAALDDRNRPVGRISRCHTGVLGQGILARGARGGISADVRPHLDALADAGVRALALGESLVTNAMTDETKDSGRKPLTLTRSVGAGTVKQSFSHGRQKTVVVETKQRRTVGVPSSGAAAAPAPSLKPRATPAGPGVPPVRQA